MELCSRGTLSAFLSSRNNPVLSENELRGVIKSLVDALIYLRKELVLHRDIKAANILLMDDFRVVSYIFCVDIVPNGVFVRNCRILALQPVCFRKSQPYRHTVGLRTMPRRTYYLY
jgi:serine/threonine protein kinase